MTDDEAVTLNTKERVSQRSKLYRLSQVMKTFLNRPISDLS